MSYGRLVFNKVWKVKRRRDLKNYFKAYSKAKS
jgi:hypothetical protein